MGRWVKGDAVSVADNLRSVWREKVTFSTSSWGLKKDNEETLLIFENVLQNCKDGMEEALLKGTVLKTGNSKSRPTLLFAVLASRLMFWRWDYLEYRRTWLISIDPLEKGAPRERWRDRLLKDRIPFRSSHLPWIQDDVQLLLLSHQEFIHCWREQSFEGRITMPVLFRVEK